MATATIETKIANPARKGKKMARKMSLKQKAAFGSKRVRAAAKAALSKQRPRTKRNRPALPKIRKVGSPKGAVYTYRGQDFLYKRDAVEARAQDKRSPKTNPGQARKVITGYGSTVMNGGKKKKKNASSGKTNVVFNKSRKRKNGSAKKAAKRKNTGALYALVNPAGRKKSMATTKKNKSQRKRPAGSTKAKKVQMNKRKNSYRKNPGTMGKPADWLALGAGAIVGGLGATSIPQMVLGSSNTGAMGYLAMAASTAILAVGAHMAFKGNVTLTSGVIAGGAGALIKRIIGDYTPFGQYLNATAGASGLGDYLSNWNFTTPQIVGGNGNTSIGTAGTIPVSVAGAGTGAGRALMNV